MCELNWIARFFTSTTFKSVVVVATVSPPLSKTDIPNDIKLPPEDTAKTKDNLAQALEEVLAGVSDPPITFLPLSDTCEHLLTKIQGAAV